MGNPTTHAIENPVEAILAASPDCFKILSADGMVRFVNDNGLRLLEGESTEELRGIHYPDLWPEDMRREVAEAIREAANGAATRVEGYCPTLKGSPRWWETHFRGIKSSPDVGTEVIGVSRDISARRSQELLLRANEERFARFVEFSGDGICEASPAGLCTFINSSGAGMLGYKPEELIGARLHETLHHHRSDGSVYAAEDCPIFSAMRTGQPIRVDDEVFWHKDGHPVPTCYSAYPIDSRYRKGGVVLTFNDHTEHRKIESDVRRMASQLSEADRRTHEFIAILAHELRNPLAPIRTGLQLMRRAGDRGTEVGHVREMMERQVSHMVHLIGDLLDIARVTSGKMELKRERVELHLVIDTALEASASLIGNANHELTIDLPHEPVYIDGDATRLAQIFTNILNNAAKYTSAGGQISVTAIRTDRQVVIDVSDSGIGIAAGALVSIFDMFTTVGRHLEGAPGGLGIGLNLVRRLVELHGGSVVATSEGLGHGSHFLVTLPMASTGEAELAVVAADRIADAVAPPRVKVLLVDDNVDAAASLSLLLELEGHVTRIANSGGEALEIVADFKPDIVLLDLGMPDMNGYEVARAIRKLPDAGNPVLVALTGWGGEADRMRSKNAGFDEHLTKPADIDTIEKLLAKLDPHAR